MEWSRNLWVIFIVINGITDICKKKISLIACLTGCIAAVYLLICNVHNHMTVVELIISGFIRIIPGVLLMGISFVSRQAIGMGDGLIISITGLFLGMIETIEILFWALLCSAAAGSCFIVIRKANRKTELPFVPFILLGYFLYQSLFC